MMYIPPPPVQPSWPGVLVAAALHVQLGLVSLRLAANARAAYYALRSAGAAHAPGPSVASVRA
jgi:hypothetical protein